MKQRSISLVFLTLLCMLLSGEVFAVQTKPPKSTSWYVYTTSGESDSTLYTWMYNKGYEAGQIDLNTAGTQNSVAVLDFGQPWYQNNVYGTWSFNGTYGRFVSVSVIKEAVKQFSSGYYWGAGSDTSSQMRVVIGTNNYGSYTTYAHGQAWIQLVKDATTAVSSYASQVSVRGGSDIEIGYSGPSTASLWVNGYASGFSSPYYLYNYGDAAGCPTSGTTSSPGNCDNGWTQDDVEYVSWGASPMYPLPEIYSTAGGNAKQWQQIALYSYLAYSSDMVVLAPLSQSAACAQRGGCSGTNNTPQQAWNQLWTELNSDSRTAQDMQWSTDIKWRQ